MQYTPSSGTVEPQGDSLRQAWRDLVNLRLPDEAAGRRPDWPVSLNHCFARILLDNAVGCPWRQRIAPPAWKNAPPDILQRAVDLGERVLRGDESLHDLNDRSLKMRGKPVRRHPYRSSKG